MPKPNYRFQRMERERQKAEKKRKRQEAKAEKAKLAKGGGDGEAIDDQVDSGAEDDTATGAAVDGDLVGSRSGAGGDS